MVSDAKGSFVVGKEGWGWMMEGESRVKMLRHAFIGNGAKVI